MSSTLEGNFSAMAEAEMLRALGLPYNPRAVSASAPWLSQCMDPYCQNLLRAGDNCSQFDVLLNIEVPDSDSKKSFFVGLVYSSWAMLALTALVVYLTFNSFPDYQDANAWEASVNQVAKLCCCGATLEAAAADGCDPASKEIGKSLHQLFGGIDLDPSDRLLGLMLVSAEQSRRRQKNALDALEATGVAVKRTPFTRLRETVKSVTQGALRAASGTLLTKSEKKADGGSSPSMAPSLGSPNPLGVMDGVPSYRAPLSQQQAPGQHSSGLDARAAAKQKAAAEQASSLPASPFFNSFAGLPAAYPVTTSECFSAKGRGSPPTSRHKQRPSLRVPMYRQTVFSLDPEGTHEASLVGTPPAWQGGAVLATADKGADDMGGQAAGQHSAVSSHEPTLRKVYSLSSPTIAAGSSLPAGPGEQTTSTTSLSGPLPSSSGSAPASLSAGSSDTAPSGPSSLPGQHGKGADVMQGKTMGLRLVDEYRPMLVPSGCTRQLQISPQEAADIYTGFREQVPRDLVEEAQRISRFAIAAYGLRMNALWGRGKRPAACSGNVNLMAKCAGSCFRMENKFRKRNFDAIVDITGVNPADMIYVSYANAASGLLPYMIMLHRPSKSIVLGVRGTVSMSDMVTDLLSSPLEVGGWMPEWVEEAGDGKEMFAHAGIVASATAVLKDLEDRGLLEDLLLSQLTRTEDECSSSTPTPTTMARSGVWGGGGLAAKLGLWQRQQQQQQQQQEQGQQQAATVLDTLPSEAVTPPPQEQGAAVEALPDVARLSPGSEVRLPLSRAHTMLRSRLRSDGWQLVVTGHSLGAAVACMLSFQLRDRFPDLRCWAFNPPGGLLSWNLSEVAQCFCTSVVVGKDLISRLSFNNTKRLVDEMVTALARCKRSKLLVLGGMLARRRQQPHLRQGRLCDFEDVSPEALDTLERYYRSFQAYGEQPAMFPPGKLLFLRPFKGQKPQQTVWDAVWVDGPALMSEGIIVSPAMMAHHRVFVMEDALRSALANEAEHAEHGPQDDEEEEDGPEEDAAPATDPVHGGLDMV